VEEAVATNDSQLSLNALQAMNIPISRDLQEIRDLNSQAWALRKENRHKALQMTFQAKSLLSNCPDAEQVDEFEILKTQTYCLDRIGKPDEALSVGLQASQLAEEIKDDFMICTIQGLLGRIFWHIDDFPTALNYFLSALKLVPSGAHLELEISLINGLGLVQFGLGNYPESLEHFMTCLDKAGDDEANGRADANNNIAYALYMMGRTQDALKYGLTALAQQKQLGSVGGVMETLHTLGAIHLTLENHDKALILLNEGLNLARQQDSQLLEVTFALELSRLFRVIGDLTRAEATGLEALEIAKQIGSISNISSIHKLLAEVYEERNDKNAALTHFQAFHAAYVRIFNGKFDQRIKVLEIIRELEVSRRQADLYRELAGTDLLTRLFNRRGLMEHLNQAVARSKRQDTFGAVQFLDIDHFKQLNDTRGHASGDRLLMAVADRLRTVVRATDAVARFGGDEFVVVLEGLGSDPQIASDLTERMAEKIRLTLSEEYDLAGIRYRTSASVGSTQFRGDEVSIDQILKAADAAMYAEKRKRGQVQADALAQISNR
jgi:diguanylate cyclase (GGDEF)-like protein